MGIPVNPQEKNITGTNSFTVFPFHETFIVFFNQKRRRQYAQKDNLVKHDNDNFRLLPHDAAKLKLTHSQLKPLIKLLARNAAKRDYAILLKQHLQKTGATPQKG